MLDATVHCCPRCGGAIAREAYATRRLPDRVDQFMLCEFCGIGFERSLYPDGDIFALEYHERLEPVCFGKFCQRLADAHAA